MADNASEENVALMPGSEDEVFDEDQTSRLFRRVKKVVCVCSVGCTSPDHLCAIVLSIMLIALSLSFTISHYQSAFPNYVVPALIITLESLAAVCLVLTMCCTSTRPGDDCAADADLQPWHRFIRRNIKLFGIVPFFFAILVFDFFRLSASRTCHDAWVACSDDVVRREHVTDEGYPVARTVYLFIELIFCVKFNEVDFQFSAVDFCQNRLLVVGLVVVQVTNLSIWLDALLDESDVFSAASNWKSEIWLCFNETGLNVSKHFEQCFSRTTVEYNLLEFASPYLYPFIMEYLMLVIECVFHWFFSNACRCRIELREAASLSFGASTTNDENAARRVSIASYRSMNTEEQPQLEASVASTSDAIQSASMITAEDRLEVISQPTTSVNAEQQPAEQRANGLDGTGSIQSTSTSTVDAESGQEVSHDQTHVRPVDDTAHMHRVLVSCYNRFVKHCKRCPLLLVAVLGSIILSIVYVIFGIYNLVTGATGYLDTFMEYRIFYWLMLSLILAPLGYVVSFRFPSGPRNLNGFEYLVIISCIGPILQSILTIIAAVQTKGFVVPLKIFCAEAFFNVMHICTQLVFYARVKSMKAYENEANSKNCRLILVGVIWSFAVSNFALWVEDSFIETRSSVTSWQKQYFDQWPLMYNVFNPLALVFRFNSALLFLNILFDKRLVR